MISYSSLWFSLDYDGKCESIDVFEEDGKDLVDQVSFEDVDKLVSRLKKSLSGFVISPHRTEVEIEWDDDIMDITLQYYNSPDWNDYEVIELNDKAPVRFDYNN